MEELPNGWRLLGRDEVVVGGDRYHIIITSVSNNENDWKPCKNSIGQRASIYLQMGYYMIRRKEQPEPDKEWLNPWE